MGNEADGPGRYSKAYLNERLKLMASYFNGLAIALFVAGLLPIILRVNSTHEDAIFAIDPIYLASLYTSGEWKMILSCMMLSIVAQKVGVRCLRGMKD